ncbi:Hypothetical predicted protein [Pelobates cultripes]|uniref:Uncharacterized protein n=1 Tax=Pelobates cultripes TaxID=61616 RepID=A0AAD1VSA1_PELCU|nr:Hypothetical predicted protein [Pelobates cultripes]
MAHPKAQRASDFFRQGRRDKTQPEQDGGGSHSPTLASDQGSDTETTQPLPGDISMSEKRMSAMLQELRSSMKEDLQLAVNDIRREVHEVGSRLNALEEKTDDLCLANDGILERVHKLEEEQMHLTVKLADLEDRSCRNNIRVRGVPETILGADLPVYLQQLFKAIQPTMELADLRLDTAHRVSKPAKLAQDIPRDIVTKLHYFSAKEAILTAQRQATAMPPLAMLISLWDEQAESLGPIPGLSDYRHPCTPTTSGPGVDQSSKKELTGLLRTSLLQRTLQFHLPDPLGTLHGELNPPNLLLGEGPGLEEIGYFTT